MSNKKLFFHLVIAFALGILVFIIPRSEGKRFEISGESEKELFNRGGSWLDGKGTVNKVVTKFVFNIFN